MGKPKKDKERRKREYSICSLPAANDEVEFWVLEREEGQEVWKGLAAVSDAERAYDLVDRLNLAERLSDKVTPIESASRPR